jgi:hypothetical protein
MSAEQDYESVTHKCGQCGKEYNFGAFAASRSPCCSVVCYPLQGGPLIALGGLPNDGGNETIDLYLSRGNPPGVRR